MNDILPAQTPVWRYLETIFAQLLDYRAKCGRDFEIHCVELNGVLMF